MRTRFLIKMKQAMNIIVCLSLLGYCLALTRFSKWPVEYTPFFVISTVITLLYCFAYWGVLKSGADAILILGSLLFLASPIFLLQQKNQLWEKYFTPGSIISIGFLGLFALLAYHAHFSKWDEFTQWGPHSKLIFYHNGFFTKSDVTVLKSYPPGSALFQYLFFCVSSYSEGTAYVAQCILMMAPLSILIHKYKWQSWQKALIAYASVLLVFLLLHVEIGPNESLYMDDAVGIYFGMSMVAYFASQKNTGVILYLIPTIATLSLLKTKLYPLTLMALFVILIDQLIVNRKNIILKMLALITLPITVYLITHSWHHYLSTIDTPLARQLHLTFTQIKNTFFAPTGSFSHAVIINYFKGLKLAILFLVSIFSLNIITFFLYQNKSQKVTLAAACITLLLGFIAFTFGLLLMYLFTFTPYEAVNHASMSRYLNIYYIGWSLVALYFLFDAIRYFGKKYIENIFVFCIAAGLLFFVFHPHQNNISQLRQPITKITNAIKKVTRPNDKIFSIWQNSTGFERAIMVYELTPRKPNLGCVSFGKPYNKHDIWTCNVNPKKLQQQLHGFDYLLLAYSDKNFWSHYQSIIPKHNTLKPLVTYTICHGKTFNSFGNSGCSPKQYHAYLFKIINRGNQIYLKNIF